MYLLTLYYFLWKQLKPSAPPVPAKRLRGPPSGTEGHLALRAAECTGHARRGSSDPRPAGSHSQGDPPKARSWCLGRACLFPPTGCQEWSIAPQDALPACNAAALAWGPSRRSGCRNRPDGGRGQEAGGSSGSRADLRQPLEVTPHYPTSLSKPFFPVRILFLSHSGFS